MNRRTRSLPYPPHVLKRIRRLRKKKGLPQRAVAAVLGISQQAYSLYERGICEIHIEEFLLLARLFDVSVDYITGVSNLVRKYPEY